MTTTVRESYPPFARTAGVRSHLVVTAERVARQSRHDISSAGDTTTAPPQALFFCAADTPANQLAVQAWVGSPFDHHRSRSMHGTISR